jgi:hypothetical protein
MKVRSVSWVVELKDEVYGLLLRDVDRRCEYAVEKNIVSLGIWYEIELGQDVDISQERTARMGVKETYYLVQAKESPSCKDHVVSIQQQHTVAERRYERGSKPLMLTFKEGVVINLSLTSPGLTSWLRDRRKRGLNKQ